MSTLTDSLARRAGAASGVFSTSRQIGGAPAAAVSGALLASPAAFTRGPRLRVSLLIAAAGQDSSAS